MIYKCPKCNGKGYYWDRSDLLIETLFTAGVMTIINALTEPDEAGAKKPCGICDESGIIREAI